MTDTTAIDPDWLTPDPELPGLSDAEQYAADAEEVVHDDNVLARITNLARELLRAQARSAFLDQELKKSNQLVAHLKSIALPAAMDAAAQNMCTTLDGFVAERDNKLWASIPADWPVEKREKAFMWLKANDGGHLVTNEIKLTFGKGEEQRLAYVLDLLKTNDVAVDSQTTAVHHMTLSAWVRERVLAGKPVDNELLGVHTRSEVTVRDPRKPKGRKQNT